MPTNIDFKEMRKLGTPETLQEAIDRGIMLGPLCHIRERTFEAVREFLANKFQAAMLRSSGAMEDEGLRQLFKSITKQKIEELEGDE